MGQLTTPDAIFTRSVMDADRNGLKRAIALRSHSGGSTITKDWRRSISDGNCKRNVMISQTKLIINSRLNNKKPNDLPGNSCVIFHDQIDMTTRVSLSRMRKTNLLLESRQGKTNLLKLCCSRNLRLKGW